MSHYVFHPHHEAVVVSAEEYPTYLKSGWYDSPSKFPNASMAGSQPEPAEEAAAASEMPKKKGRPPKARAECERNGADDEPLDAA